MECGSNRTPWIIDIRSLAHTLPRDFTTILIQHTLRSFAHMMPRCAFTRIAPSSRPAEQ